MTDTKLKPAGDVAERNDAAGSQPVTLRRTVASEWIKFTTLRSTVSVLAVAAVGMVLIALLIGYNTRHLGASLDANDVVVSSTLQGLYLAQLLIGALGVLFVTGEFSTGSIRSTMTAVPRRLPVVWAKLIVFLAAVLPTMVVACLAAFLLAQAEISYYRTGFSLGDPGALRIVLGTAVYLAVIGVIGGCVGWIVRSTPGAIVTFLAIILVVPVIFGEVLGHWGKHVAEFLPAQAGASFIMTIRDQPSLSPWPGLVVLLAWAVVLVGAAVVTLRRRDV